MKNIVICADGTGNTTIKGRGTNVFKLYEAVDQSGHRANSALRPQVALYHDGVGTESLKWLRVLTGATGWGLSRNVKQLYGELARVYAPGDKIFLFGFSRGAFTVRTLAGLIHACGILDLAKAPTNSAFNANVRKAYAEYRRGYNSWLTGLFSKTKKLTEARVAELRARFSVGVPEFQDDQHGKLIEFMGVWDTVDAVGLPIAAAGFVNRVIYAFKFPDRILNPSVAHACHALAIDEEREAFEPVLWDESKTANPGRIEQVWFAGVHSNVGGGYPRQGMSLVTLDWIMTKAEEPPHNLRFVLAERLMYRSHADVDDKMYDSRRGFGIFYLWKPRNIQRLCDMNGMTPNVHRSVFERIARSTEGYAPGSIPADPVVVSISQTATVTDDIRSIVRKHHGGGGPLLEREAIAQGIGRWSYRLFVYSVVLTVLATLKEIVASQFAGDATWWEIVAGVVGTLASWKSVTFVFQTLCQYPWLIFWFLFALGSGLAVDQRLDRRYSHFWHADYIRLELRKRMGLG